VNKTDKPKEVLPGLFRFSSQSPCLCHAKYYHHVNSSQKNKTSVLGQSRTLK
jgi:hypothetical protein